jgi:hypothetical protein
MSLSIAESLYATRPTLSEPGIEARTINVAELIAGTFAVTVYSDQIYSGETKPENVQFGLTGLAHEITNVIETPDRTY